MTNNSLNKDKKLEAFSRLLDIMDDLREKCPWDKKQTFESLRILTLEECYELADSILDADIEGIREEIGDLMLHMVFYSKIAEEKNAFDIADAMHSVCDKCTPCARCSLKLFDHDLSHSKCVTNAHHALAVR